MGQYGVVRAKYRIPDPPFPEGDWLTVKVVARVYDREEVERSGGLPDVPIAEGVEVEGTARRTWSMIDLPLPAAPLGHYAVVAKVYSADDRYRRLFDPSNCYVGVVSFGLVTRMKLADLQAVYEGIGNPLAEEEIKLQVRGGGVVVEREDGVLFAAREANGQLAVTPLRS